MDNRFAKNGDASQVIRPISEAVSNKIANLGFVCVCLVVPIHIVHPVAGYAGWLDRILAGGISNVAVPTFFVISGYLLAGHMEGCWWAKEVRKRIMTLVVPFFIWNGIAFFSILPLSFYCDCRDGLVLGTVFWSGVDWERVLIDLLGIDLTNMPLVGALWYVRALMILVALSPLIKRVLDRFGWWWIGFSFASFAGWRLYAYALPNDVNGFFWYGIPLSGLVAFSLGIFLRIRDFHIARRSLIFPFVLVGFCMWILSWRAIGIWADIGKVILIPTMGVSLWLIIPETRFSGFLIAAAFPIYLMHQIILGYLQSVPSIIPSPECVVGYVIHVLTPIVTSIIMSVGIRLFFPKWAMIGFGGR